MCCTVGRGNQILLSTAWIALLFLVIVLFDLQGAEAEWNLLYQIRFDKSELRIGRISEICVSEFI